MKNHYDKIFFAVALVLLIASLLIFFTGQSGLNAFKSKNGTLRSLGAQGETWDAKDVKTTVSKSMSWRYPEAQDAKGDWLFQVFTPPRIWMDAEGNFITQAPLIVREVVKTEAKCEVELLAVTSAEYGIKLRGYIGSADPTFEFIDSSKNVEFSGKNGQALVYKDPDDITGKTMIDLGLKVVAFSKERVTYEDGTIADVMLVDIEDKAMGKVVQLRSDKPTLLLDQRMMKLVAINDPAKEWFLSKVGEEFIYNASKYVVKEISFDEGFIVLEQTADTADLLPSTVKLNLKEEVLVAPNKEDSEESE